MEKRTGTTIGQGLDLFDINIGKKQFGFKRSVVSNPLQPIYSNEYREGYNRLKRGVPSRHTSKIKAMEKVLDKIYWKAEQLPQLCREHDPLEKNMVSHDQFHKCLEQMGVKLSDDEFNEIILYADNKHTGFVKYKEFTRAVRRFEGLEYSAPKRLGEDTGAPTADVNLGQGLQVFIGPPQRGKRIWASAQHQFYNPLTGEPNKIISSTVASREPLCCSYAEQAASLSSKQHQLSFVSFMPAESHFLKIPPISPMESLSRQKSLNPDLMNQIADFTHNESNDESSVKENLYVSADKFKLQPPQQEVIVAGQAFKQKHHDILDTSLKIKMPPAIRKKHIGEVRKDESLSLRSN